MQGKPLATPLATVKHVISGKIQLQVLSGCGHTVHEDAPDKVGVVKRVWFIVLKVAHIIASHLIRYKLGIAKDDYQKYDYHYNNY